MRLPTTPDPSFQENVFTNSLRRRDNSKKSSKELSGNKKTQDIKNPKEMNLSSEEMASLSDAVKIDKTSNGDQVTLDDITPPLDRTKSPSTSNAPVDDSRSKVQKVESSKLLSSLDKTSFQDHKN